VHTSQFTDGLTGREVRSLLRVLRRLESPFDSIRVWSPSAVILCLANVLRLKLRHLLHPSSSCIELLEKAGIRSIARYVWSQDVILLFGEQRRDYVAIRPRHYVLGSLRGKSLQRFSRKYHLRRLLGSIVNVILPSIDLGRVLPVPHRYWTAPPFPPLVIERIPISWPLEPRKELS
jgi:hypothetical protein